MSVGSPIIFDDAEDRADFVGFARLLEDAQGARGRGLHLVGGLVAFQREQRLAFDRLSTAGNKPFGQRPSFIEKPILGRRISVAIRTYPTW